MEPDKRKRKGRFYDGNWKKETDCSLCKRNAFKRMGARNGKGSSKGEWDRRNPCDGWIVHHSAFALCGNEGQSEGIYRDYRIVPDNRGAEYSYRSIAQEKNDMKKETGNIGNLLMTGICILAMTIVMAVYLDCTELIRQKGQVSQLARRYILKMETTGCLEAGDRGRLLLELEEIGATQIDLTGTTLNQAPYSAPVTLKIQGKLGGKFTFEEKRVSTSKN